MPPIECPATTTGPDGMVAVTGLPLQVRVA